MQRRGSVRGEVAVGARLAAIQCLSVGRLASSSSAVLGCMWFALGARRRTIPPVPDDGDRRPRLIVRTHTHTHSSRGQTSGNWLLRLPRADVVNSSSGCRTSTRLPAPLYGLAFLIVTKLLSCSYDSLEQSKPRGCSHLYSFPKETPAWFPIPGCLFCIARVL